ncbi:MULTISPECIES: c-type cytochrome [Rhodoplanes]|nr:cytochrome c [Rhodoplanes elegans]
MTIRTMLAAAMLVSGLTAAGMTVVAAQDVIAQRKAIMKANGDQARTGALMARGEMPFDLAKAQAIFATYAESATKSKDLYPESAKTGGDTAADPKIWQSMSDFQAKLAKFGQDAAAAKDKVKDEASFKATFSEVQKNCGGCHESYRIKKS